MKKILILVNHVSLHDVFTLGKLLVMIIPSPFDLLRSNLPTSLVSRCIKFSVKMASAPSTHTFQFNPTMNHEDMLKEMHNKVHTCTLSSKLTMQVIISVTRTYEVICGTARAAAAVANVLYVQHTMAEYLTLIDRPVHLVHVAAVAAALAAGNAATSVIPFSEPLTDAHDETKMHSI